MSFAATNNPVKERAEFTRSVLIVDDDRDFGDALCEHLAVQGYQAQAAYSGRDAKAIVHADEPQVALLDLHLRGENGLALMSRMKEIHPDILCVVVTGYPQVESVVEALRNGAYDYLLKPVQMDELLATLQRCFDKLRLEAEKQAAEEALQRAKTELERRNADLGDLVIQHIQTESALRESEKKFSAVLDNSPSGITLQDTRGRYLLVNRRMEKWMNFSASETEGKSSQDLFPRDISEVFTAKNREVLSVGQVREFELDVPFADGQWRTMVITKFPVFDNAGQITGVGTIKTDVSGQRSAEEQLRQAQKMEAVGQLTGGIAHDFNNLLTVVLGNLQLLRDSTQGDSRAQSYADTALKATYRGADLTQRLQAFSRQQALDPLVINVNELVPETSEMLKRTLGEDIEIEIRLTDKVWNALVDPNQLQNALLNLAVNARDAMPQGGKLTIETANLRLDQDYAEFQSEVRPGNYVTLAVSDTGVGMTPEVKARAFDPFFTTKQIGQGSGLGLSMVYGFIKQSGGHVSIRTQEGEGTTVKVLLPKAEAKEPVSTSVQNSHGALPGGNETILVVEDDPDVRALVVASLGKLGYRILEAEHGPGAIALAEKAAKIDLLLSDVVLPRGMNGREVAEEISKRFPQIKCLFTSGYTENAIIHHGRLVRGVELLSKPYKREALARKVRDVLDRD
jgi:PAS domain S-box-containing protein